MKRWEKERWIWDERWTMGTLEMNDEGYRDEGIGREFYNLGIHNIQDINNISYNLHTIITRYNHIACISIIFSLYHDSD